MPKGKKTPLGKPTPRRVDRRYNDPANAPLIVSEKRMTLFVSHDVNREMRRQTGLFVARNAELGFVEGKLPESPSALVREAIDFWLDQFRDEAGATRTEDEWAGRLSAMADVISKHE